jgi:6-methylsalicylate decarboxylase
VARRRVLGLGAPFGVWGTVALDRPEPDEVDGLLRRGAAGLCLPAAALAGPAEVERAGPLLERLERAGAPLFVHPGPAGGPTAWWPALSGYVAQQQAAWLAWVAWGRAAHPELRVLFAFLAGLAPLQAERLAARGGPGGAARDASVWLDSSSYGPVALEAVARITGPGRIVFGSDLPWSRSPPARRTARTLTTPRPRSSARRRRSAHEPARPRADGS